MKVKLGNKHFDFSLNTLWGGVCIVAVALLLLVFGLLKSNQKININDEIEQITAGIRTHFQKSMDYRGLNTEFAVKNGLIPASYIRVNKIFSKTKSEIKIGKDLNAQTLMPTDDFFGIVYLNLDRNKCQNALLSKFDASSGLMSVTLRNDDIYEFSYGGELPLPVSVKNAKKYCKAKNTIMFTFE